jgi:RNA polymerase sigma factor (sigma-70 family)
MQATDRAALFEKIFYSTKDRVFGFTKKILQDDSKVQDCMQQCYMKLWESMDRIDTEKEMLPLLYTYARNSCIDHLRKNARYVWMEDIGVLTEKMNVENDIEGRLRSRDADTKITELFNQMSSRRRQVFTLVKVNGFSYREVSEQLNISISTVEKHMHAASKSLSRETIVKLIVFLFVTQTLR